MMRMAESEERFGRKGFRLRDVFLSCKLESILNLQAVLGSYS